MDLDHLDRDFRTDVRRLIRRLKRTNHIKYIVYYEGYIIFAHSSFDLTIKKRAIDKGDNLGFWKATKLLDYYEEE